LFIVTPIVVIFILIVIIIALVVFVIVFIDVVAALALGLLSLFVPLIWINSFESDVESLTVG
jgi:hypothetical protein